MATAIRCVVLPNTETVSIEQHDIRQSNRPQKQNPHQLARVGVSLFGGLGRNRTIDTRIFNVGGSLKTHVL